MSLFKKKTPPVTNGPADMALEHRELLAKQHEKLSRAEDLKERSSAVAASLAQEGIINHWAQRIRESYAANEGTPNHAHP